MDPDMIWICVRSCRRRPNIWRIIVRPLAEEEVMLILLLLRSSVLTVNIWTLLSPTIYIYIYLYLSNRPPWPPSILIVVRWGSKPGSYARLVLGYTPKVLKMIQYYLCRSHPTLYWYPLPPYLPVPVLIPGNLAAPPPVPDTPDVTTALPPLYPGVALPPDTVP